MSDKIYIGASVNVAEVGTITIGGTVAVGNTFTVTLGKASVTFTATTTVIADAVAGILALLQATTARGEFQTVTWTSASPVITGTGPSDGYPWTDGLSVSKAQGSGGTNSHTIAKATSTSGTGNQTWTNTGNWAGGVIPVAGDRIHLGMYGVVPKYKIDQSALASWGTTVYVYAGNTSGLFIGLSEINSNGYPEYLNRYLKIKAKLIYGTGTGSYYPKLNFEMTDMNSTHNTHEIYRSDSRDSQGKAPIQLIGTSGGGVGQSLLINGGNVDLCLEEGETLPCYCLGNVTCSGDLRVYGPTMIDNGSSITVLNGGYVFWGPKIDGTAYRSMANMVTVRTGGTLTAGRQNGGGNGVVEIDTLTIESGATVNWNRSKSGFAIATNVYNSGVLDFRGDSRGEKLITQYVAYPGSQLFDPNSVVTFDATIPVSNNGIVLNQCSLSGNNSAVIDLGKNRTFIIP